MSRAWLCLVASAVLLGASCTQVPHSTMPASSPPQKAPHPIPANLSECWAELDRLLPEERKNKLRDDENAVIEEHFGIGMSIRNAWGLWGGSELHEYIEALGREAPGRYSRFSHGDSKSGYILESYRMHLLNPELTEAEFIAIEREQHEKAMREYRSRRAEKAED